MDYNGDKASKALAGQKTEVYDVGHHIPLIARWPNRIAAHSESDAFVALLDVMATTAEDAGKKQLTGRLALADPLPRYSRGARRW